MKLWKVIFLVWVFFWAFFLWRGLYYKGGLDKYKTLLSKSGEERKTHLMKEGLYAFSRFCVRSLPKESTYRIKGPIKPIDERKLVYYLYPRMPSDDPEYILCFKEAEGSAGGNFRRFATLGSDMFILKREGM